MLCISSVWSINHVMTSRIKLKRKISRKRWESNRRLLAVKPKRYLCAMLTFQVLPMILSCGKTINFLKRTGFSSPVLNFAPAVLDEDIELIMTPEEVTQSWTEMPWYIRDNLKRIAYLPQPCMSRKMSADLFPWKLDHFKLQKNLTLLTPVNFSLFPFWVGS